LRAIYKGPISAEQLLSDLRLIDGRAKETLAAASPLPGRWGQPPGGSSPQQIVIKFLEGGFTEDARNYLEALIQDPETKTVGLLNLLGGIYLDQQEFSKAAAVFRSALVLDPNDRKAHLELGTLFLAAKQGSLAEVHFSKILTTTPNDPDLLQQLGRSFLFQGKLDSAREAFEKARTLANSSGLQASLVELATSYFDAGNLDQASDALELVPLETAGAEALRERLGSARSEK
jgi:Tfp pilus assembly protein PilF